MGGNARQTSPMRAEQGENPPETIQVSEVERDRNAGRAWGEVVS